MKRVLAVMVAILMVCAIASVCYADKVDITTLTEAQKKELYKELGFYFFGSAYENGVNAGLGTYKAGFDIPAGAYILTFSSEDDVTVFAKIYDDAGNFSSSCDVTAKGGIVKINLQEGYSLQLVSFSTSYPITVNIKPFGGLFGK